MIKEKLGLFEELFCFVFIYFFRVIVNFYVVQLLFQFYVFFDVFFVFSDDFQIVFSNVVLVDVLEF